MKGVVWLLTLCLLVVIPFEVRAQAKTGTGPSEQDFAAIASEAYIYGYPLVTMEINRRVSTNVAKPEGSKAPMGQFARLRTYPPPSDHTIAMPNADTLYTIAWLDVSKEPWVLSIPDMQDRYFLIPLLSGWTDVFQAPGTRTTGTKAQRYAITGPGWAGTLPEGVTEYKSPTGMVWVFGKLYCTGTAEDYKAVHALQDNFSVVPLSAYGKPYTSPEGKVDPSIDMKTEVHAQVNAMDGAAYFKLLAALLKANPPAPADAPMVAKLAKVGIVPGQDFDISKVDPAVAKALQDAPKSAQKRIMAQRMSLGAPINGWRYQTNWGVYGTQYLLRAFVTAVGLGSNLSQDSVYAASPTDAEGKPYNGANKYVMRFDKGQMPPVQAFWSLTMYDADFWFVPNELNRYTLSSRNKFKTNPDGSVDLYVQNLSPGKDGEANWLPAPPSNFILMLRLYWPKQSPPSIFDGSWKPPAVKRVQ